MTERSLQITYRKGRPFAAYLHLSHETGEKVAKSLPSPDGLLVIDYAANGQPLGVEITAPLAVSLERLNRLLADLGELPLAEQEYVKAPAQLSRFRRSFVTGHEVPPGERPSRAGFQILFRPNSVRLGREF